MTDLLDGVHRRLAQTTGSSASHGHRVGDITEGGARRLLLLDGATQRCALLNGGKATLTSNSGHGNTRLDYALMMKNKKNDDEAKNNK
jgi:hypothetical protein